MKNGEKGGTHRDKSCDAAGGGCQAAQEAWTHDRRTPPATPWMGLLRGPPCTLPGLPTPSASFAGWQESGSSDKNSYTQSSVQGMANDGDNRAQNGPLSLWACFPGGGHCASCVQPVSTMQGALLVSSRLLQLVHRCPGHVASPRGQNFKLGTLEWLIGRGNSGVHLT